MNARIAQLLNQAAEEALPKNASHPYYGIKDVSGWLTRYPLYDGEGIPLNIISRSFIERYVRAGGSLDSQEVYGISPYYGDYPRVLFSYFTPEIIGYLCSIERWDNIRYGLETVMEAGCDVHHGISRSDFGRLVTGANRLIHLRRSGAKLLPVMSLGHMSETRFYRHLVKTWTRFDCNAVRDATWVQSLRYDEDENELPKISLPEHHFFKWAEACEEKFQQKQRRRIRIFSSDLAVPYNPHLSSIKAANWRMSWSKDQFDKYREARNGKSLVRNLFNVNSAHTTVGQVYYVSAATILRYKGRIVHTHSVGVYRTAKIQNTCFLWRGSFREHVEGDSLRDCLRKIQAQEKINARKGGLVFCLNDVRNDVTGGVAHYCLAGTKEFLKNRMPHVYRLVKKYSSWNEIPEEILAIDWQLASRDIFNGYPQP